jgi:hypothetical protein
VHVELSDLTPRFLDSSLHMFFTKFIPILPIIHQPTFVYRDCSAHLLLNAIALGSLFLGTEDATGKVSVLKTGFVFKLREAKPSLGRSFVETRTYSYCYFMVTNDRTQEDIRCVQWRGVGFDCALEPNVCSSFKGK